MSRRLLNELAQLALRQGGDVAEFAPLLGDLDQKPALPQSLPVCRLIPEAAPLANARTAATTKALIDAAPALKWQQSYTEVDGFSQHYLDNYGWVNIASREGLFVTDSIRVSIGYWGAGLTYPKHTHEPEEFYLVLAGQAVFNSEGEKLNLAGPGDVIHHRPNQPHSIDMTPGPLLAAAFWRGAGLLDISSFPGTKT
ncbi:MAG: cupin domain-containing protein [Boseongicola sp.]|nr:MAG: cupin domain-containing protein [Boseongicola sp.]